MKFKKFVAALSAVTMLGSLAAAVPAIAKDTRKIDLSYTAYTGKIAKADTSDAIANKILITGYYTGDDTKKYKNMTDSDLETTARIGNSGTNNRLVLVDLGENHTVTKVVFNRLQERGIIGLTNTLPDATNASEGSTVDLTLDYAKRVNSLKTNETYNPNNLTIKLELEKLAENYNIGTESTVKYTISGDDIMNYRYVAIHCNNGLLDVGEIECYYDVPVATETLTISSDNYTYPTKLYKGDSINLSAVATPNDAEDEITWSFTGVDGTDCSSSFVWNAEKTAVTYNNNGRIDGGTGNTQGDVVIKANAGSAESNEITVKTQRLSHMSYLITDSSGEKPNMIVTAKAGEKTAYENEIVTYGSEQHSRQNSYSGNSDYVMTFTVPNGYTLTLDSKDKCEITTEGQIVTIKNTDALDNDFYVTGTLTKNAAATHTEAFTFTKTANEFGENAMVKIVFQNDETKVTQEGNPVALGTTFTGEGIANLAVVITNISSGYSVQSVTIE